MKYTTYEIENDNLDPLAITIGGRPRWALQALMRGPVTPITRPAPRWSAYVFELRKLGVDIETVHIPHGGEFSGTHGRYRLVSKVSVVGGCG